MQVQLQRLKDLKVQAKQDITDRKQLLMPARKEMTALTKMEGELKVAKLPEHLHGANPLEKAKSKLAKIINDVEFHRDDDDKSRDESKKLLEKAIDEGKLTRKMMRPFC